MKSKAGKFLNHLMIYPKQTYQNMQQFFYRLNYPDRDIKTMSRGYYCTNIQKLIYKGHIKKDKNKLYSITKTGIKYKDTPYAQTAKEKRQQSEFIKRREVIESYEQRQADYDSWTVKRITERGHVRNVRDLIAFLKTFPNHARVTLAIDEEINATGDIFKQVAVDDIDNVNEITLIPVNVELTA
tara:strand:- start:813 stop:1364 length:552 start_codon:yes stop_codon:yes gene_type:complete